MGRILKFIFMDGKHEQFGIKKIWARILLKEKWFGKLMAYHFILLSLPVDSNCLIIDSSEANGIEYITV